MINRIIVSFFFAELLLAVGISLVWFAGGVEPHQIQLGTPFISFMNSCNRDLNSFKIAIPNIPSIPSLDAIREINNFWDVIVNLLVNIANAFFTFLNGVIKLLNFLIQIINVVIELLEFIFIILKNAIVLRDTLANA